VSQIEDRLAMYVRAARLPEPEREQMLIPGRRFRVDFVWRIPRLVVEVEGGTFVQGRHTTGAGFAVDAEKYNLLTLAGWRVLRVTSGQVKSGLALLWIEQALGVTEPLSASTVDQQLRKGQR
jgi:very-short-patch-repair endonuclease